MDQVEISGNVRTLDEVIRREVLLLEGDAFNTSKLRRSRDSELETSDFSNALT